MKRLLIRYVFRN